MSRGAQHRVWSQVPANRALMVKVEAAHFHHASQYSGLTYQACRFCQTGAAQNIDEHDPACWFIKNQGECHGLWKYAIRHYVCSACRHNILLGLPPRRVEAQP